MRNGRVTLITISSIASLPAGIALPLRSSVDIHNLIAIRARDVLRTSLAGRGLAATNHHGDLHPLKRCALQ
jgi:hypothetical protein